MSEVKDFPTFNASGKYTENNMYEVSVQIGKNNFNSVWDCSEGADFEFMFTSVLIECTQKLIREFKDKK